MYMYMFICIDGAPAGAPCDELVAAQPSAGCTPGCGHGMDAGHPGCGLPQHMGPQGTQPRDTVQVAPPRFRTAATAITGPTIGAQTDRGFCSRGCAFTHTHPGAWLPMRPEPPNPGKPGRGSPTEDPSPRGPRGGVYRGPAHSDHGRVPCGTQFLSARDHINVYIYIYMYIHTYIYICIYRYTYIRRPFGVWGSKFEGEA